MSKIFEDEFMDIQIRMVSTCLEGLEDSVSNSPDKMYIYAFDSSSQSFFNVFFVREGKVVSFHDLGVPDDIISQVLDCGMDDVAELTELCNNSNKKAPNQYKLVYNFVTDKLDTDYEYDDLSKSKSGPADVFVKWEKSVAKTLMH